MHVHTQPTFDLPKGCKCQAAANPQMYTQEAAEDTSAPGCGCWTGDGSRRHLRTFPFPNPRQTSLINRSTIPRCAWRTCSGASKKL